jgi:hypothetical protein
MYMDGQMPAMSVVIGKNHALLICQVLCEKSG